MHKMSNYPWAEFTLLFGLSLIGDLAVLPYILKLIKSSAQRTGKPLKMSVPKLLLVSFLQTAVLLGIAVGIGLLAAHAIGLGAPYVEATLEGHTVLPAFLAMLPLAVIIGVLCGLALLVMEIAFLPHLPAPLLDTARTIKQWENLIASFYGGLAEEFLMRLFGLSVLAWLLSRIWHTTAGMPTVLDFWIVNIVMSILFGLGHLPAAKGILGRISPVMFARTMLLNGSVGIVFGWLFWQYGLEAAVIGHFVTDIIIHCGATLVLHLNDRYHVVKTQTTMPGPLASA